MRFSPKVFFLISLVVPQNDLDLLFAENVGNLKYDMGFDQEKSLLGKENLSYIKHIQLSSCINSYAIFESLSLKRKFQSLKFAKNLKWTFL